MGQTLTNGVYLPDEGERNCYAGLAANWNILDGAVGTVAEHTSALSGKAPLVHTHTKSDITDFPAYGTTAGTICEGNDSRLSDARTPVAHTHVKSDVTDLFNSTNTWSASQTYTDTYIKNPDVTWGVEPSSAKHRNLYFTDSTDTAIGYVRRRITNGSQGIYIAGRAPVKNGQLDPTGDLITWGFSQIFSSDGTTYFTFDGSIGNSVIPKTNNSYDLGSSSYQWNNLYAKNYFYNGTAWGLDKANVWSNIQTVSYSGSNVAFALKHTETNIASSPTRNNWFYINFYDVNSISVGGFCYSKRTSGDARLHLNLRTKNANSDIIEKNIFFETNQEGTIWNLYPSSNANINLGSTTYKWKTLNGVNPGALSLPDYNNVLDVTSEIPIASLDGNTQININDYLPNKTGWLSIVVDDTAGNSIIATQGRPGGSTAYNNSRTFHTGTQSNGLISVFFPILADMNKFVSIKASSLIQMRFYYCLGNV